MRFKQLVVFGLGLGLFGCAASDSDPTSAPLPPRQPN